MSVNRFPLSVRNGITQNNHCYQLKRSETEENICMQVLLNLKHTINLSCLGGKTEVHLFYEIVN